MKLGKIGRTTPIATHLLADLGFLNDLCHVVASSTQLQPILDWIVQKTTTMFRADEGSIRLLEPDQPDPITRTLVRKGVSGASSGSWPPTVARHVMGFLMTKGEPLATPDLLDDPRFPSLKPEATRIRSVLAVPLRVENRFIGMLAVTQVTPGRKWRQDEVQLLSIVASNSAGVIEQARLRVEAMEKVLLEKEKRATEVELKHARDMQMSLLPPGSLQLGRWEAHGRVVPAHHVGGDSFDYYPLGGKRMALAIADVCGKGIPAALLTSNLQGQLRAFCNGLHPIAEAVHLVNQSVARRVPEGKFITLFYGELNLENGRLRYVNAGHNPPLIRRSDGTLIELGEGGFPLGIELDATYAEGEVPLNPGDSLLLFSDGILDACDPTGQWFGEDRLRAAWLGRGDRPPGEVVKMLLSEVDRFRGPTPPIDDITLVAVASKP